MALFDRTEKKLAKGFEKQLPAPGTAWRFLAVPGSCAVLLLMVVAGVFFSAGWGTAWANDSEIRIADSKGDWGYPTPFRHYPRGPGYVRMSWVFDTLVWKDQAGFVPALARTWSYAPFLSDIGGTMPVIPKHVWEKITDPRSCIDPACMVGSRPYVFRDFDKTQGTYLFEAFEDYYQGPPKKKRLIYVRTSKPLMSLVTGQVDLANIQPDMADSLEKKGLTVIENERGWNKKLMINHTRAPFDDRTFRQALAYAIDQQEIIDKSHRGFGTPASFGLLSIDHEMYNPDTPAYPYTLALARAFPTMDAVRDLGGIRGDAFYRMVHAHAAENGHTHVHTHVAAPDAFHQGGHAPPEGCLFRPRCTQAIPACSWGQVEMEITPDGDHRVRCIRGGIAKILEFRQVGKSYGSVTALHPTDLTLMAGEVFCLVGETGSGKTTLAMIAAGAVTPDRGTRTFQGRDMDQWMKKQAASLAPRIGIIYQNPAESVSHRLTVFEIVAEPLRIHNTVTDAAELTDRIRSALSDVRLSSAPEFLKRYPHELNMGTIQRVCLARALVHEPDLLIADEPTSALDPSVQAKVLKMLLNLQIEKGLTLLLVTHNIGLARKVADRIGVMSGGRIIETGTAARIIHHPDHEYTRTLIRSARGLNRPLPAGSSST